MAVQRRKLTVYFCLMCRIDGLKKRRSGDRMNYGYGYGYDSCGYDPCYTGYAYPAPAVGGVAVGGYRGGFALIVVLFILLIIIGASYCK